MWRGLTLTNNWMAGQRPRAEQGKQCPLYTRGHTHQEYTRGMRVGQRGYRREECPIGINDGVKTDLKSGALTETYIKALDCTH